MVNTVMPASMAQSPKALPRRMTIYFQDDAVRQHAQANVQQLLVTASSPDASSNSALLVKKALKYRKVYDRMTSVDVTSPEFDASKFLGVDWRKTKNLKAHCARAHRSMNLLQWASTRSST